MDSVFQIIRVGDIKRLNHFFIEICEREREQVLNLSVISEAVIFDQIDVVRLLLNKGANIEATRNYTLQRHNKNVLFENVTAVWIAALRGSYRCVQVLTNAGANVNATSKCGVTPFLIALECRKYFCFITLSRTQNVNIFQRNPKGRNGFMIACKHSSILLALSFLTECFKRNVNVKWFVNETDCEGNTALHIIAKHGDSQAVTIAQRIISVGGKQMFNKANISPGMVAALRRNYEMMMILLREDSSQLCTLACLRAASYFSIECLEYSHHMESMRRILNGIDLRACFNHSTLRFHDLISSSRNFVIPTSADDIHHPFEYALIILEQHIGVWNKHFFQCIYNYIRYYLIIETSLDIKYMLKIIRILFDTFDEQVTKKFSSHVQYSLHTYRLKKLFIKLLVYLLIFLKINKEKLTFDDLNETINDMMCSCNLLLQTRMQYEYDEISSYVFGFMLNVLVTYPEIIQQNKNSLFNDILIPFHRKCCRPFELKLIQVIIQSYTSHTQHVAEQLVNILLDTSSQIYIIPNEINVYKQKSTVELALSYPLSSKSIVKALINTKNCDIDIGNGTFVKQKLLDLGLLSPKDIVEKETLKCLAARKCASLNDATSNHQFNKTIEEFISNHSYSLNESIKNCGPYT